MTHASDVQPLSSFIRDHMSYLSRLRTSGQPIVLTIQDRPRLVVQDAEAYQKLIDLINELDAERRQKKSPAPSDPAEPAEPAESCVPSGPSVPAVPPDRVLANMRKQLKRTTKK